MSTAAFVVTNRSEGFLPVPSVYGGGVLAPGQSLIINDTQANIASQFGNISSGYLDVEATIPNQTGSVTPPVKAGTATLVAGTVTVEGVTLSAESSIALSYNTPGGTTGTLSAPSASRVAGSNGTGSFVINSSSSSDTSTVDWHITG